MKKVKKVAVGLCVLIMLFCFGIIYIACNPEVSDRLAAYLYGDENHEGILKKTEQKEVPLVEETEEEKEDWNPQDYEPMDKPLSYESKVEPEAAVTPNQSETNKQDPNKPGQSSTSSEVVDPQKVTVIEVMSERPEGKVPVYSKPLIEAIDTPDELKKKTGYVEISDTSTEIKADEADKIEEEGTTGIVGSDYYFDTEFYPYYGMLDTNQQALYKQIYGNANEKITNFSPCVDIDVKKVKDTFEAVYNDHPELFFLETGYGCKYLSDGRCVELSLSYNKLAENLDENKKVFYAKIDKIVENASAYTDPYEQEKYVHNILMEMITYDAQATNNQSAYSAVIENKTVCAGYARAFQLSMQKLGIPCYYCTGYSGENHAWNIVKLSGDYYNVDVTWDDTEPATYKFFNKTDHEFSSTHLRKGLAEQLPACIGTLYGGLEDKAPGEKEDTESEEKEDEVLQTILGNYEDLPEGLVDYYSACYENIVNRGIGYYEFRIEVNATDWSYIEEAYKDGSFRAGFLDYAVNRLGANGCSMKIEALLLENGKYRLDHYVEVWK